MKLKSSIEKTNHFMKIALTEAVKAKNRNEVPVGSVIIDETNNIIASNGNRIIELSDPTAHAEILCIREASKKIQSERLNRCRQANQCHQMRSFVPDRQIHSCQRSPNSLGEGHAEEWRNA